MVVTSNIDRLLTTVHRECSSTLLIKLIQNLSTYTLSTKPRKILPTKAFAKREDRNQQFSASTLPRIMSKSNNPGDK